MAKGKAGAVVGVMSAIPPHVYLIVLGLPIAYFGVVRPILKKVGIIDTAESKQEDKIIDKLKKGKFWNPSWYQSHGGVTITDRVADQWAKKIKDSFGTWNDNEEQIYSVFSQLRSKGNVSKVAEAYYRLYSTDLITELDDRMGDDELMEIAIKITNYE